MEEERVVDTASRSPLLPPRLNYFLLFPDDFNAQLWINMSRRNEELSRPTLARETFPTLAGLERRGVSRISSSPRDFDRFRGDG